MNDLRSLVVAVNDQHANMPVVLPSSVSPPARVASAASAAETSTVTSAPQAASPSVALQTMMPTMSTSSPSAADVAETFINASTTSVMPPQVTPQTTVPTMSTSSPPAADAIRSSDAIGSFASSLVPRRLVGVDVDQLLGNDEDDEDDDDFDLAYPDDALSHTPEYGEAIRLLCPHNAKNAQCETFKQCSEGVFLCEKFRNGSCEETSFSHTGSISLRNKNRSLPPGRRDNVRLVHIKPLCRTMREHGVCNKLGCFYSHSHVREFEETQAKRRQVSLDRQAAVRDEGTERQQNTIRRALRGARPHDLAKWMDENPDRVNADLRRAVERTLQATTLQATTSQATTLQCITTLSPAAVTTLSPAADAAGATLFAASPALPPTSPATVSAGARCLGLDEMLADDEENPFDYASPSDRHSDTADYIDAIQKICPHNAKNGMCDTFAECSNGVFICTDFRNGNCQHSTFSHEGTVLSRARNRSQQHVLHSRVTLVHNMPICKQLRLHGVCSQQARTFSHSHVRLFKEAQAVRQSDTLTRHEAARRAVTARQSESISRALVGARPRDLLEWVKAHPERVNQGLYRAVQRLSTKYWKAQAGGEMDTPDLQWLVFT